LVSIADVEAIQYSFAMQVNTFIIILSCLWICSCSLSPEEIAENLEQKYSYRCVTQGYMIDTKEHTECMISMIQSNYSKRVTYKTTVEPLVYKNEEVLDQDLDQPEVKVDEDGK
jgi:hypothetical protein